MHWEKARVVTEDEVWAEDQKKEWEWAEEKDKGVKWGGNNKVDSLPQLS